MRVVFLWNNHNVFAVVKFSEVASHIERGHAQVSWPYRALITVRKMEINNMRGFMVSNIAKPFMALTMACVALEVL